MKEKMRLPLIKVDPSLEAISNKYKIPLTTLSMFSGSPEAIAKALQNAIDYQVLSVRGVMEGRVSLLFKPLRFYPVSYDPDAKQLEVRVYCKSCVVEAVMTVNSPEEALRKLTGWVYARGSYNSLNNTVKAEIFEAIELPSDVETAVSLYQKYKRNGLRYPLLRAWITAMALSSTKLVDGLIEDGGGLALLILVRLIPLVSPQPVHIFELSKPNTGKTTFALIYRDVFNWDYFNEIPSLPTLVGDARSGYSRIVSVDGVWFDEFEKWFSKQYSLGYLSEIVEVLLTGMEQGVWKRGKGGEKVIEVNKSLPVYLSGNLPVVEENPRRYLEGLIDSAVKSAGKPFSERIAVCVMGVNVSRFTDALFTPTSKTSMLYPRPSVLRGLRELSLEVYKRYADAKVPEARLNGRLERHYYRVARALMALMDGEAETASRLAERLVSGMIIKRGDRGE